MLPVSQAGDELGLVGQDAVVLVLESGHAAVNGPGGRIVDIRRMQVFVPAHERGQQVVLPVAAPAGGVEQRGVAVELVDHAHGQHVGVDIVVITERAVEVGSCPRARQLPSSGRAGSGVL